MFEKMYQNKTVIQELSKDEDRNVIVIKSKREKVEIPVKE